MVKAIIYFKTLLHLAIFHAILLRRKLHQKLPSVSYQDGKFSRHFLLPQALQKVKFDSTFHNDRGNDFIDSFNVTLRSATSSATFLAMLSSISQSESSLLSSPWSSSAVPLHSVTPLFVQLQCYAQTLRDKLQEKSRNVTAPFKEGYARLFCTCNACHFHYT